MANGTSFPASSYGTYSVPAFGVDESITVAGWIYLPTSPANGDFINLGSIPLPFYAEFSSTSGWGFGSDYSGLVGFTLSGGWVYLAMVFSRTSFTCYWRHAEHQEMGRSAASSFTYDGAAYTGRVDGAGQDLQHWGVWQTALTRAQVQAQSLSTSPIVTAYSWFPLNANDGTGTIGSRNMTLVSTTSASREAPSSSLATIDVTKATAFGDNYNGHIRVPHSPFATSYSITVSAWVWLGSKERNSYVMHLSDAAQYEHLIFVCQHAAGSNNFETNLMSRETVDWGGSAKRDTVTACEGWVFSAWVITSSGTTRTLAKHYGQFGRFGELTDWGTITAPSCTETGWSSDMQLVCNWTSPEKFRLMHARVHIGELTQSQIAALAVSSAPDETAWCHLPLTDTSAQDVSGNDRHGEVSYEVFPADGIDFEAAEVPQVEYVGAGALAGNAAAISPAIPTGTIEGDMLYALFATANQATTIANANGGTWTEETGSPQGTGTAAGTSAVRLTVFRSVYNGTQGAPTTNDSGDHQVGQIIAYRGQAVTDPVNITSAGVEATNDTSWSITGATTTADNCRVVIIAAWMNDSAAARFSNWTNADLTGLTERVDAGSTAGNGSGFGIADGLKATAGAYGATTVTNSTATVKAFMTIALEPEPVAESETIVQASASIGDKDHVVTVASRTAGTACAVNDNGSLAVVPTWAMSSEVSISDSALFDVIASSVYGGEASVTSLLCVDSVDVEATVASCVASVISSVASVAVDYAKIRPGASSLSDSSSFAASAFRSRSPSVQMSASDALSVSGYRISTVSVGVSGITEIIVSPASIKNGHLDLYEVASFDVISRGSPIRVRFVLNSRAASCIVSKRAATVTTRERAATLSLRERAASFRLRKGLP